jgi:hypothetical protein
MQEFAVLTLVRVQCVPSSNHNVLLYMVVMGAFGESKDYDSLADTVLSSKIFGEYLIVSKWMSALGLYIVLWPSFVIFPLGVKKSLTEGLVDASKGGFMVAVRMTVLVSVVAVICLFRLCLLALGSAMYVYLLPGVLAQRRNAPNYERIYIFCAFSGWLFIPWVGALLLVLITPIALGETQFEPEW